MKGLSKLLTSLAFLILVSTLTSCENTPKSIPFEGDWENKGSYIVFFEPSGGYFKDLTGDMWLDAKNSNKIAIGEKCYKNIKSTKDKNTYECQIRVYNSFSPYETLSWEDCTLTLNSNNSILTVHTADGGLFNLEKYNP